jgi:lipopolysaccharide export system ATP-binding protein
MSAGVPSTVTCRGLAKRFGGTHGVLAVDGLDLDVPAGSVFGLLGPNGAGKTTTFYMVVGLVRADEGEISIDGQPVQGLPIHRRSRMGLSYLPQEASIFRKLTVAENIRAVL